MSDSKCEVFSLNGWTSYEVKKSQTVEFNPSIEYVEQKVEDDKNSDKYLLYCIHEKKYFKSEIKSGKVKHFCAAKEKDVINEIGKFNHDCNVTYQNPLFGRHSCMFLVRHFKIYSNSEIENTKFYQKVRIPLSLYLRMTRRVALAEKIQQAVFTQRTSEHNSKE